MEQSGGLPLEDVGCLVGVSSAPPFILLCTTSFHIGNRIFIGGSYILYRTFLVSSHDDDTVRKRAKLNLIRMVRFGCICAYIYRTGTVYVLLGPKYGRKGCAWNTLPASEF